MSTFKISKNHEAAKPFFENHMKMLVERYCSEVPDGQTKKIVSINLVKEKEGDKERTLAEYYERLLELSRDEFAEQGIEIVYRAFGWHKKTKNGTEPFSELLESLDEDTLR